MKFSVSSSSSAATLQVMAAVHGVYQALLSLKNIPTLEAAYKLVLGEMACALSSLRVTLKVSGRAPAAGVAGPSIEHPAFAQLSIPLDKAQFTLVFNLSTLTTIGNTKNSLIGVSAAVLLVGQSEGFRLKEETTGVLLLDCSVFHSSLLNLDTLTTFFFFALSGSWVVSTRRPH